MKFDRLSLLAAGLLSVATTASAAPQFKVITDLDDTIKITHVKRKVSAALNGIFTTKSFAGTSELLQAMNGPTAETIILTASPKQLRFRVVDFLENNEINASQIILKNKMSDSTPVYKTAKLTEIAQADEAQFILFGDDTEYDPEVFTGFAQNHPGKVAAVYIRKNLDRPLPTGATGYSTVFEPALLEVAAGRMSPVDAINVGLAVLADKHQRVLPSFSACRDSGSNLATDPEMKKLEQQINERLRTICQTYKHDG